MFEIAVRLTIAIASASFIMSLFITKIKWDATMVLFATSAGFLTLAQIAGLTETIAK